MQVSPLKYSTTYNTTEYVNTMTHSRLYVFLPFDWGVYAALSAFIYKNTIFH